MLADFGDGLLVRAQVVEVAGIKEECSFSVRYPQRDRANTENSSTLWLGLRHRRIEIWLKLLLIRHPYSSALDDEGQSLSFVDREWQYCDGHCGPIIGRSVMGERNFSNAIATLSSDIAVAKANFKALALLLVGEALGFRAFGISSITFDEGLDYPIEITTPLGKILGRLGYSFGGQVTSGVAEFYSFNQLGTTRLRGVLLGASMSWKFADGKPFPMADGHPDTYGVGQLVKQLFTEQVRAISEQSELHLQTRPPDGSS